MQQIVLIVFAGRLNRPFTVWMVEFKFKHKSSSVDKAIEISNLELVNDLAKPYDYLVSIE